MDGIPLDFHSERHFAPISDIPRALARYRVPDHRRSVFELAVTAIPYIALWIAAWAALSVSVWLTLAIAMSAGLFLMRLFLIQHDCGHGAFFRRRVVNNWVGRVLGVLTQTPYYVWRRSHAIHHATSGNLDKRGVGDINVLTVNEYRALPRSRRFIYQIYRHPLTIFGLAPGYIFFLRNRVPPGISRASWRFWISAMGTNAALVLVVGSLIYFIGVRALFAGAFAEFTCCRVYRRLDVLCPAPVRRDLLGPRSCLEFARCRALWQFLLRLAWHIAMDHRQYRHPPCASSQQQHSLLSLAASVARSSRTRPGQTPDLAEKLRLPKVSALGRGQAQTCLVRRNPLTLNHLAAM